MEELLKVTNAFRPQGIKTPSNFDLNNADNGIYTLNSNDAYANQPVNKYGVLLSFIDGNYYGFQLFVPIGVSDDIIYYRQRGSVQTGWYSWYKLTGVKI